MYRIFDRCSRRRWIEGKIMKEYLMGEIWVRNPTKEGKVLERFFLVLDTYRWTYTPVTVSPMFFPFSISYIAGGWQKRQGWSLRTPKEVFSKLKKFWERETKFRTRFGDEITSSEAFFFLRTLFLPLFRDRTCIHRKRECVLTKRGWRRSENGSLNYPFCS